MYSGSVVWFNAGRGFGFVKRDGDDDEFFCHFSNIEMDGYKKVNQGDRVEFDVESGPKGKPQAVNVRVTAKAVA